MSPRLKKLNLLLRGRPGAVIMAAEKEMMSVRMPAELGAALRAHADEAGESLSDVLRRACLLVLGKCPTCEREWPDVISAQLWTPGGPVTEVVGIDATHANIGQLPPDLQYAGYSTGSPDIRWTPQDWAAHSGALRIDQDAVASDGTADYLDVERGAATNADAPLWYRRAVISYRAGLRPGQRWPGIYTSQSNVTPLVNTLIAAGVTSGPRLIIARWDLLATLDDILAIARAGGPFPIVGWQVQSFPAFDLDLFSAAWLGAVSRSPAPPPPPLKDQIELGLGELSADVSELIALARRLP